MMFLGSEDLKNKIGLHSLGFGLLAVLAWVECIF